MRIIIVLMVLAFSLFSGGRIFANALPALPHSSNLVKGFQALEQGQWALGESLISKAPGSISAQLFYWKKYSASQPVGKIEWIRISRFIRSHDDWPSLATMKKNAEAVMPKDLEKSAVITWFQKYSPVSADAKLRYLTALKETKNDAAFRKNLMEYWTKDLFGDRAQAKFLRAHGGILSKSLRNKRLSLLLAHHYYDTALHLASQMGKGEVALVKAVKSLSKSHRNVNALISNVPASLQSHPALVYERIKWRRKKGMNDGAIALLKNAPSMTKDMNPYQWWKERHVIIRRLIEDKSYAAAYELASHHKQKEGLGLSEAEFLSGWLALRFLNKPHQAYQNFQTLYRNVKTPISKARGAYWAGRAADDLGRKEQAQSWYAKASYFGTTYYGQRASKEIESSLGVKQVLSYGHAPITLSTVTWNKWMGDDRVIMMRLLYKAGFQDQASLFLFAMLGNGEHKAEDFMALAKITRLANFPYAEVKVAKKAAYNSVVLIGSDGVLYGYPTLPTVPQKKSIGASHIHAIVRQESEFHSKVTSPAGAKGYMQLMPATAKEVARSLNIKHQKSWLLSRPSHNVTLGSQYLDGLVYKYKNLQLAAAGYNAGPHRVSKWVDVFQDPRTPKISMVDWVELIPFSETRNYVQRVSEAEMVYRIISK